MMKKFKVLSILAAVLMLVGLLCGCNKPSQEAAQTPITVTDALGRTVEFDSLPQRIVIAGKGTTLLANSAFMFPEAQDRVISYELRLQMPERNFIKTIFTKTANLPLLDKESGPEQIAPLKPDLVILKTYMKEKLGASIEALGIKVVYLDLETPEKFYQDIRTLGLIFGNESHAEEIIKKYQDNDARITSAMKELTDAEKPSVLLLQYSSKGGEVAFNVPPMEWLQTILVQNAGGNPVWKDIPTEGGWAVVSLEQIAAWNPDMIFIVDYSGKAVDVVSNLKSDANWQALKAVQNEKIFAFPVDFLSWDQADPRWGLGELWLASKIQPDKLGPINMQDEINNFYKNYYGLNDSVITEKVMPLVAGDL
jgi:iron complex transport system substrate-binding protein